MASGLVGALIDSGNKLIRRRPVDLATFLAALDVTEPRRLLDSAEGRRDARHHLDLAWEQTVSSLARPESLPEVVERRARTRVHPAAPWLTAAVAGGGGALVVSGSQPAPLEAVGVLAVVGVTAIGSAWTWRPRTAGRDRKFTVSGASAVLARAQALAAGQSVGDPEALRAADRLLALVQGDAQEAEAAEEAARAAGVVTPQGTLLPEGQLSPAHRAVADEVLTQRAELVRGLLHLQGAVLRISEDDRRIRREEYRRIVEDLDG
ncbi:hypothetical protein BJ980_000623 [Nocardioides daedukensis]|uniref:Uncharacterized protein n=1 Tax=Nocardioides daedukensis TaxID=634462 RepID=A0A7Y9RWT9_9ACTN|nr:hypothetical protein [Nocardioides daedukensis]NYG57700.1 hypothetical protein [Nocardioides daedukensis]